MYNFPYKKSSFYRVVARLYLAFLSFLLLEGEALSKENDSQGIHKSVLLREVLDHFSCLDKGSSICDLTLGRGGHTSYLLENGFQVLGFDQDKEAIEYTEKKFSSYHASFVAIHKNFRYALEVLESRNQSPVDGLLLDLGVSSPQLDQASRGFSFMREGPLDMRMDNSSGSPVSEIVNSYEEKELAKIIWELGEERSSRKIAKAIVESRQESDFQTTLDLANVIESVIPRRGKKHPATKTFQALRMYVNDELGALREILDTVPQLLSKGGIFACISFHSLEDRMVKRTLKEYSTKWLDAPEWPAPKPNPKFSMKLIQRKAIQPVADEVNVNPRARSAKLRVAQKN